MCDLEGTNNKWSNDGLTISGFIVLGRESTGLDSGAKSLFVNAVRWELVSGSYKAPRATGSRHRAWLT